MKKALLTLFCIFCLANTHAQKIELHVSANSGLFSYRGNATASTTFINGNDVAGRSYTNNPYGAKNGWSYGLAANAKTIFAKAFILGLDFGYEQLNSKVDIVSYNTGITKDSYAATGKTYLKTDFLNLHPNLGVRFGQSALLFDLTAGFDIGFILNATEKGEATTTNGIQVSTSIDRKNIKSDIRPRGQLAIQYLKFGIYGGYAQGLTNYKSGYMVGGASEAKSRIIRFGLTYQIK